MGLSVNYVFLLLFIDDVKMYVLEIVVNRTFIYIDFYSLKPPLLY